MKNKQMIHVLKELSHFSAPVSEQLVRKCVLENTKNGRKGLTKDEVLERGLNIYEKRDRSIDSLIEEGVDNGLLDLCFDENRKEYQLKITGEGDNYLIEFFTNHHSEAFRQFEKEVNELTDRRGETAFSKRMIANLFHHGHTVEDTEKHYCSDKIIQQEVSLFHERYMEKLGIRAEADEFILHLMPQLFLPNELVGEPVSLKIEGLDVEDGIVLGSPYRNKRYVVAGTKVGGEKLLTGFYVKGNREFFEKERVIRYVWTVGEELTFTHELTLSFAFDKGNFFSTAQRFNRDVNIQTVDLRTFVEEVYTENSERQLTYTGEGGRATVTEKALLTSFPLHLHYAFGGNKTFQDWVVKTLYS